MRLVLLGAPGAGKGTQAIRIARLLSVPHISTGEIFRNNIKNRTPIGIKAGEYINAGQLVPDEITEEMVRSRLDEKDCSDGFVLDGFPRTISQAEFLDKYLSDRQLKLDAVVELDIDDDKIVYRICGRRVCTVCGENYHIENKKPKVEGICDICSATLIQRPDDRVETIKSRLEVYNRETKPLIDYYNGRGILIRVDGDGELNSISRNVLKALGVVND